jgi:hypothetical protein
VQILSESVKWENGQQPDKAGCLRGRFSVPSKYDHSWESQFCQYDIVCDLMPAYISLTAKSMPAKCEVDRGKLDIIHEKTNFAVLAYLSRYSTAQDAKPIDRKYLRRKDPRGDAAAFGCCRSVWPARDSKIAITA